LAAHPVRVVAADRFSPDYDSHCCHAVTARNHNACAIYGRHASVCLLKVVNKLTPDRARVT
jgi:hypothetical protein